MLRTLTRKSAAGALPSIKRLARMSINCLLPQHFLPIGIYMNEVLRTWAAQKQLHDSHPC